MWYANSVVNRDDKLNDLTDANYKRVLLSVVLTIFPGLGQVYSGHLLRGVIGYLGLILISWLCAILFLRIDSRLLSILVLCIPFIYAFGICIDAAFCAIRQTSNSTKSKPSFPFINVVMFILLFVSANAAMDYLVGKHVVRALFVTTGSMFPTILNHDLILVDKLSKPANHDVVLLEFSNEKNDSSISSIITDQVLRRIIATEGDVVEIRGKQTYINDKHIEDNYATYGISDSHNIYSFSDYSWGPETVPKGSYFVLSDSRQYGFDSRSLGFISKSNIQGVAAKILWSWNLDDGFFKWDRTALNID
jgi:signal peptidase I